MTVSRPDLYRGEPAPRRRWLALLLTLLMPGLGHVYAGRFGPGLLRYLAGFFAAVAALLAWRAFLFQPHLPLVVLSAAYLVYVAVLLREAWDLAGPAADGGEYVLQGFNHPAIYAALLLLCHVLPGALLVDRVGHDLVGAADVSDGAMFPMLFIGDRVLLDRTAYRAAPPRLGDLVALRRPGGGNADLVVRRAVAGPRDTVEFVGRHLVINGQELERQALGDLSLSGVDNRGEPAGVRLAGWRESAGATSYVVTHRPDLDRAGPEPIVLPEDRYYVLSDNRDSGPDSRDFGPVPRASIAGRPLYVWWSADPNHGGATAWTRIGLAAR